MIINDKDHSIEIYYNSKLQWYVSWKNYYKNKIFNLHNGVYCLKET